jgi:hypothetical protein
MQKTTLDNRLTPGNRLTSINRFTGNRLISVNRITGNRFTPGKTDSQYATDSH